MGCVSKCETLNDIIRCIITSNMNEAIKTGASLNTKAYKYIYIDMNLDNGK